MKPRSRTVLAGIGVAVFGALIAFLVQREPRAVSHEGAADVERAPEASSLPSKLSDAADPIVTSGVSTSASRAANGAERNDVEPLAPAADPKRKPTIVVRGSVILTDAQGRAVMPWDGVLSFTVYSADESGRSIAINPCRELVTNGDWSVELAEASKFHFGPLALVAGDRNVVIDEPTGYFTLPPERFLEVRAHFPPPASLRVVDADSGRDLAGVQLASRRRNENSSPRHPGVDHGNRVIAFDLQSPIDLDYHLQLQQRTNVNVLHVGAEGYAWSTAPIDFGWGGERLIALERGADLEVEVRGLDTSRRTSLRVITVPAGELLLDQPLPARDALRVRGLPAGHVLVSVDVVQVRGGTQEQLHLAQAYAELIAGASTSVVLDVVPSAAFGDASISGILFVPETWDVPDAIISVEPLERGIDAGISRTAVGRAIDSPRGGQRAFEFEIGRMPSGRCALAVVDPPFAFLVDVPPAGISGLALEVPPPCELSLKVVDPRSNAALGPLLVQCVSLTGGARVPVYATQFADFDDATRTHTLLMPCGEVEVTIDEAEWQPIVRRIDVTGRASTTIELAPACGIVLRLSDKGIPVSFSGDAGAGLRKIGDEEARVVSFERGLFEQHYKLVKPGEYELIAPHVPGYLAPAPERVTVPADGYVTHTVRLERLRR